MPQVRSHSAHKRADAGARELGVWKGQRAMGPSRNRESFVVASRCQGASGSGLPFSLRAESVPGDRVPRPHVCCPLESTAQEAAVDQPLGLRVQFTRHTMTVQPTSSHTHDGGAWDGGRQSRLCLCRSLRDGTMHRSRPVLQTTLFSVYLKGRETDTGREERSPVWRFIPQMPGQAEPGDWSSPRGLVRGGRDPMPGLSSAVSQGGCIGLEAGTRRRRDLTQALRCRLYTAQAPASPPHPSPYPGLRFRSPTQRLAPSCAESEVGPRMTVKHFEFCLRRCPLAAPCPQHGVSALGLSPELRTSSLLPFLLSPSGRVPWPCTACEWTPGLRGGQETLLV